MSERPRKLIDPTAIQVRFAPKLRSDGELVRVIITQGSSEIQLTKEQAQALAQQIYGRDPDYERDRAIDDRRNRSNDE